MARKSNYKFERSERDRAKAAKIARKADEKAERRERGAAKSSEPSSES
jgi:hypothetical protein